MDGYYRLIDKYIHKDLDIHIYWYIDNGPFHLYQGLILAFTYEPKQILKDIIFQNANNFKRQMVY